MSLRFAAARTGSASPVARVLFRGAALTAANDNATSFADDGILHAALRHFAVHGMDAARNARARAEDAFFAGDRETYDWWREVCQKLDRRMAREIRGDTVTDTPGLGAG